MVRRYGSGRGVIRVRWVLKMFNQSLVTSTATSTGFGRDARRSRRDACATQLKDGFAQFRQGTAIAAHGFLQGERSAGAEEKVVDLEVGIGEFFGSDEDFYVGEGFYVFAEE